jgi:hypothetical protein
MYYELYVLLLFMIIIVSDAIPLSDYNDDLISDFRLTFLRQSHMEVIICKNGDPIAMILINLLLIWWINAYCEEFKLETLFIGLFII